MIWWSLSTSIGEILEDNFESKKDEISFILGKASLAKQKILSIFHHVSNTHKFPSFTEFKECAHGEIVETRPWIKAGTI